MKLFFKILLFLFTIFCTNISEAKIIVLDEVFSKTSFSNLFNSEKSSVKLRSVYSKNELANTCKSELDLVACRSLVISSKAIAAKGGGSLIAKGLGSTGRTTAANLTEQLAMKEIVANPTLGKTVMTGMNITHDHWK